MMGEALQNRGHLGSHRKGAVYCPGESYEMSCISLIRGNFSSLLRGNSLSIFLMVSEVKYKSIPDSLVASFQENVENQLLHTRGLALYFPGVDWSLENISTGYKTMGF